MMHIVILNPLMLFSFLFFCSLLKMSFWRSNHKLAKRFVRRQPILRFVGRLKKEQYRKKIIKKKVVVVMKDRQNRQNAVYIEYFADRFQVIFSKSTTLSIISSIFIYILYVVCSHSRVYSESETQQNT